MFSNLCQAIPGGNFVDVPDVVLPSVDGEQASVGVIELKDRLMSSFLRVHGSVSGKSKS